MGQAHLRAVDLERVVGRSDAIVVARALPGTIQRTLRIEALGPYAVPVTTLRVVRVLHARGDRPPDEVEVAPANLARNVGLARDFHVRGMSRHYVEEVYEGVPASTGEDRIYFLAQDVVQDEWFWTLSAPGAIESSDALDRVERLLGARPPGTSRRRSGPRRRP